MELHGQRSVRQGKWKLLWLPRPMGSGNWALYDLERDPAEQTNLATSFPERVGAMAGVWNRRSEEHTSELQSLMRISYAVFCLKKQKTYKEVITKEKNTKH